MTYRGVVPLPSHECDGLIGGMSSFTISVITSSSWPTHVWPPLSKPTTLAPAIGKAFFGDCADVLRGQGDVKGVERLAKAIHI